MVGSTASGASVRFQPLAQAREHRVRVVALAVHQPVDRALQPVAQRLDDHGRQPVASRDTIRLPLRLEQHAQPANDQHVDAGHGRGQGAVDQRAVDQESMLYSRWRRMAIAAATAMPRMPRLLTVMLSSVFHG